MKGKLKKNILIFFIAIVVIGAVTGYLQWNKPHRDVKGANAVVITAIELYKIFITDSVKAKAQYLNRVVEVSGEVQQVAVNQQKQQIILLKTGTPDASVNCTMEDTANNIKTGDTIMVKGICSGYISGDIDMGLPGDVFLVRCYINLKK